MWEAETSSYNLAAKTFSSTREQGQTQHKSQFCRKLLGIWVRNQFHLPQDVQVDAISMIKKQESKIIEYSNSKVVNKRKLCSVGS